MPDDFVQVAPDSTGKKIDNTTETTAVGTVERQRVSIAAAGSANALAIDAAGKIGVNNFPATQPVSAAGLTNIDVALSTRLKPADTLTGVTTVAAVTAITNALPAGTNKLGTVDIATAAAVAKGTQGANGVPTQDLKDSGRVLVMWTAEVAGAATTEGLLTVTESRDGAATTTFTSKVVTSGKRLRITSVQMAIETLGSGTAPQRAYLRMRFNTAGAVIASSPLQGTWEVINSAAVVKSGATFSFDIPDGVEYLGDGTKQIGFTIQFPDWVTTTATVQAKITITGFEY